MNIIWWILASIQVLLSIVIPLLQSTRKLSQGDYLSCRKWLVFWICAVIVHQLIEPMLNVTLGYLSPTMHQIVQIVICLVLILPQGAGLERMEQGIQKYQPSVQQKVSNQFQRGAKALLVKTGVHPEQS